MNEQELRDRMAAEAQVLIGDLQCVAVTAIVRIQGPEDRARGRAGLVPRALYWVADRTGRRRPRELGRRWDRRLERERAMYRRLAAAWNASQHPRTRSGQFTVTAVNDDGWGRRVFRWLTSEEVRGAYEALRAEPDWASRSWLRRAWRYVVAEWRHGSVLDPVSVRSRRA